MAYKDFFTWFKNLEGWKRIDVVYDLLTMLCPLELRFFGTCLEYMGNKDYVYLLRYENEANNANLIKNYKNLADHGDRSNLIISLALMNSTNRVCADIIFRHIYENITFLKLCNMRFDLNKNLAPEILLILNMASHHPAFSFSQKCYLFQLLHTADAIINEKFNFPLCISFNQANNGEHTKSTDTPQQTHSHNSNGGGVPANLVTTSHSVLPPLLTCPHDPSCSVHFPGKKYCQVFPGISSIEVEEILVRRGIHYIKIKVGWQNKTYTSIIKNLNDLYYFHQRVVNLIEMESLCFKTVHSLPSLPELESIQALNSYFEKLLKLEPSLIFESEFVITFFQASLPMDLLRQYIEGGAHNNNPSGVRSFTFYNSQIHNNTNNHHHHHNVLEKRTQHLVPPMPQPSLVLDAELETLLHNEHLEEYKSLLFKYNLAQLQALTVDELESMGVKKMAAKKLVGLLKNKKLISINNGISKHIISKKSGHSTSSESLSSGSSGSSPPPPPGPSLEEDRIAPIDCLLTKVGDSIPPRLPPFYTAMPAIPSTLALTNKMAAGLPAGTKIILGTMDSPICHYQLTPAIAYLSSTGVTNCTYSTTSSSTSTSTSTTTSSHGKKDHQVPPRFPPPVATPPTPGFDGAHPPAAAPPPPLYTPPYPPPPSFIGFVDIPPSDPFASIPPPAFSPPTAAPPPLHLKNNTSCYNCGKKGHLGHECTQPYFHETKPVDYVLNFSLLTQDKQN